MAKVVEKLGFMDSFGRLDFGRDGIHSSGNAAEAASCAKLPVDFLANGFGIGASPLCSGSGE